MRYFTSIKQFLGMCVSVVALVVVYGCDPHESENDGEPTGPQLIRTIFDSADDVACGEEVRLEPGPPLVRRLTNQEYVNTIVDVLGVDLNPHMHALPAESYVDGFLNTARGLTISHRHIEQYARLASLVAQELSFDSDVLLPFQHCAILDDACREGFIRDIGKKIFRRSVTDEELAQFSLIFEVVEHEAEGFERAATLIVEAMVQMPQFLYRIENIAWSTQGSPNDVVVEDDNVMALPVRPLTDFEMASRLSYLIWHSAPDTALLARAAEGRLSTQEQIADAVRSMAQDARARRAFRHYVAQWLRFDELSTLERDGGLFPEFNDSLLADMKEETFRFLESIAWGDSQDMLSMFRAAHTFVSPQLARLYGFDTSHEHGFTRYDFPEDVARRGLLTHASLLTATTEHDETSPVRRGHYVRQKFLCQTLPPPPANFAMEAAASTQGFGNRERLKVHSENPQCAFCHRFMDPVGFGLEDFDAIGAYRTHDRWGNEVDSSGELLIGRETKSFHGALELSELLAESPRVEACVVEQVYQYAMGRVPMEFDVCTLRHVQQQFRERGRTYVDLLIAVATSDSFRFVRGN